MSGINFARWLLGGLAAGLLIWLVKGATSLLYLADMEAVLASHRLAMSSRGGMVLLSLGASVLAGLVVVFLYAAARARFGPGPRTAVIVAVALWLGGGVVGLLGAAMVGLFPSRLLVTWAAIGLIELVLGAAVGGWIYRET
jgi:hypothetical protein